MYGRPRPRFENSLDELVCEHENILSLLSILEKVFIKIKEGESVPRNHLENIFFFIKNYIEALHHGKEEELLIPFVNESGLPAGGGPLCTLFKQKQMERHEIYPKDFKVKPTRISGLLEEGSPMNMILEEHQLTHYYTDKMEASLDGIENNVPEAKAQFVNNARDYIDSLREHIDKENHCFFILANQCLSAEKSNELKRDFKEIEKKLGEENIEECLTLLRELEQTYL